ncbi:MAG TPA: DNA polymerase III subunit [Candidatus Intestinimonas pullistercoris]|uniref:DNA polymerase III subunit n=1 Tax=Candidatus Intestinimonas pullistercoris TaxID=2838623 RepID=A0A9D2NY61_9FIRM|nr:DNA polymerase III subunit delta' [uncultured Intestinimonas sp.]HJC40615.1 DNA polymerase III subunit [Candidatus Intestinimonas pullistercoris]
MRGLEALCGNVQVKRRLSSGRGLSHAYLLSGPAGCGKRTLAGLLSQALVCSGAGEVPCGACDHCRKAAAGVHPDILRVGSDGKDITVSQVREVRSDAYIRPNEAGRKVYILENAQTMNGSAQNALLKLLEEGPAYAAFLLLSDNAGAMLPTVRSRCELLTLSPVTPAEAEAWLLRRFPDLPREQILDAARRCEGVLGRAVAWLEGGGQEAEEVRSAGAELARLLLSGPEGALLEYCVGLEKWERDALGELLDETVQQLRVGLSSGWDPRRVMALVDHLRKLRAALPYNVGAGHLAGWLCAGAAAL